MKILVPQFKIFVIFGAISICSFFYTNCSVRKLESNFNIPTSDQIVTLEEGLCTGEFPKNALACFGSESEILTSTSRRLVSSCSGFDRCEYICQAGFNYENGTCSPPKINSCSEITPCELGRNCSLMTGQPSAVSQSWMKGAANCGFNCINGFSGSNCETSPILPSCGGVVPANSILCRDDERELNSSELRNLVPTCTAERKCEYVCAAGFNYAGGVCQRPANSCAGAAPCTHQQQCQLTTGSPTQPNQLWVENASSCGFSCIAGFTGPNCSQPPQRFLCLEPRPSNAVVCAGDDENLSQDFAGLLTSTCTSERKCEYLCKNGFNLVGGICVQQSFSCSSVLPCLNAFNCELKTGTPSRVNQSWTLNADNCGYKCVRGYTGLNCQTSPAAQLEDTRVDGDSQALVGAYYFGVFNSGFRTAYKDAIAQWPTEVQNRPSIWWYGVEDLYLKQGPNYQDIIQKFPNYDTSYLKPAIGFHDNSLLETLETHIDQAANGGLDYFNFYWYWSKSKKSETLQDSLYAFKRAKNKFKLKFHLSIYLHPWDPDHNLTANDASIAIAQIIDHARDPQYLKVNGRPIVTIGDARANKNGTLADLKDLMGALRAGFLNANLGNPLILVQPNVVEGWGESGSDGFQCLVPSPEYVTHGGSYRTFVENHENYFTTIANLGLPYSPCVASGFDERPRFKVFIPLIQDLRFLTDFSMQHFGTALSTAEKKVRQQTNPIGKLVNIYAWNEWHEGGIIEPTEKYGAQFLEAIETRLKTRSLNLFANAAGMKVASVQNTINDFQIMKKWKLFSEFRSSQDNKVALYECKISGNNSPATFISRDPLCEGQTNVFGTRPIGFVLATKLNWTLKLLPLYRCNSNGKFHFISDNANCDSANDGSISNEGLLGYVPEEL